MASVANHLILACWLAFLAYWIISARRLKAVAEMQSRLSALAHRLPVGLGWWLLAYPKLPAPMNRMLSPDTDWARIAGVVLCAAGLLGCIWARRTLAGNWSSDVTFKQDHELVRTGPYRFVRHPIYTALLLMSLGTAAEVGRLHCWLSIPIMATGLWIKLKEEDRLLLRHFPDQYPAYKQQVKAIVPFIL